MQLKVSSIKEDSIDTPKRIVDNGTIIRTWIFNIKLFVIVNLQIKSVPLVGVIHPTKIQ